MSNELADSIDALHAAQPVRDILLVSASITRRLYHDVSMLIANEKEHEKCTLLLTTRGGDPHSGYRIARCLQHHYSHIRLCIPSICKSAGTLIAIGAHELAIGNLGELGPLDIQVPKSSELEERSSGLDIIQALEAAETHTREVFRKTLLEMRRAGHLSTRLAGKFASSLATGIAAPLYRQIDPNRIGEMQRAIRIAHAYGERLNQASHALRDGALENLMCGYPSHNFVIDRKEARELFGHVQPLTPEEIHICRILWHILEDETGHDPFFLRQQ